MTKQCKSLSTEYACTVTDTTRNLYQRALNKFWAWALSTGTLKRVRYPIPAPVLMTYVKAKLDGLPKTAVD